MMMQPKDRLMTVCNNLLAACEKKMSEPLMDMNKMINFETGHFGARDYKIRKNFLI
jgi:hypothetical protein